MLGLGLWLLGVASVALVVTRCIVYGLHKESNSVSHGQLILADLDNSITLKSSQSHLKLMANVKLSIRGSCCILL